MCGQPNTGCTWVVVGWSMSARQDCQLVVQAVLVAIWQRPTRTPVILHLDRGCQFTSEEYQQFLAVHQVTCSMSAMQGANDRTLMALGGSKSPAMLSRYAHLSS